ncbi:MAG: hypothetical protein Q9224_002591 [Gallowayella concinna]
MAVTRKWTRHPDGNLERSGQLSSGTALEFGAMEHSSPLFCRGLQHSSVPPIVAGLACTYDAIPQKKGPKGSRAKVISELRLKECQKKAEHRRQDSMHNYGSPTSSPSSPTIPGLLTQELIEECMDYYFTQLYPTMPIMQKDQMGILMDEMETSVEAYCLLYSFCAFMLIQPGIEAKAGQALGSRTTLGKRLLDDALRRRKCYDYIEHPSVNAIITSFFLFGCFFGLDKHNTAWFHLRESTTLAQIIGMQDEKSYASIEKIFDVACTLIDVLSCVPIESQNFGIGPQDYLNHLVHLISTLRDGKSRYLPLVITKIRDTLPPHMAASMTLPMIPIKVEQSPEIPFLQDSSETHSSNTSSPYSTPPFMHYYPTS